MWRCRLWGGSKLSEGAVGAGAGAGAGAGDDGFDLEGVASLESSADMAMRFEAMVGDGEMGVRRKSEKKCSRGAWQFTEFAT